MYYIYLIISDGKFQSDSSYFVVAQPFAESSPRPVLLIHNYASDSSVWNECEEHLIEDNIPYKLVTYDIDDSCGSSYQYAEELSQMINDYKLAN